MKNNKLKKKLLSYSSIVAGALSMTAQTEASIVYSGTQNIVIDTNNPYSLIDLDNNTVPDFLIFYLGYYLNTTAQGHGIYGNPYNNALMINEQITTTSPPIGVVNIPTNYSVKSTLSAGRQWFLFGFLDGYYNGIPYGNFIGTMGYIGVRFNTDCGTTYGWIQYRSNTNATVGTIIDWAYENECKPILAGDKGPQVAVPALTPAGIAAGAGLLLGAGIRTLKKKGKDKKCLKKTK